MPLLGGGRASLQTHTPIFKSTHLQSSPVGVFATIEKLSQRRHLLRLLMQPLREVKQREHNHTGTSEMATPYEALVPEAGPADHE